MKTITLIAVLFTSFLAVAAQDAPKNVIAVQGVYNRQGVTLKAPDFKYDADKDSIGGEVSFTRFLGKSPVGIGMEAGVTFHNKDVSGVFPCGAGCSVTKTGTSKVARGYFNYAMVLQKRSGSFQPFVKGVVGLQRGNFDGVSAGPGGAFRVGGGHSFVYGGGAGVDIKLGKGTFWRTGLTLTRAFNSDTSQWNALASTGLAFKF